VSVPPAQPRPAPSTVSAGAADRPARRTRGASAPAWTRPAPRAVVGRAAIGLLLWGYAAVALGPLLLMVANSLRPTAEIFAHPLGLPTAPSAAAYARAWSEASFARFLTNSLLVTVLAVALGTAVSVLAAYPLARYRFPGAGLLSAYFLSGLMLPIRLGILPIFYLLASFRLIDQHLGLILVYAASGVPFSVFVLTGFFRTLPGELEEAARIDGAGDLRIFAQVMLPLVRPALATVVVFQFVPLWNDFIYPLVLLRTTEKATLPVGLTLFFGEFQTDWSTLFAGLVIATVPLVALFLVATKQIIAGLTAGMGK
jgi:raffinose/stachyose/melibiose transport system permease protein